MCRRRAIRPQACGRPGRGRRPSDVGGGQVHTFPATLPFRVGEEAPEYLCLESALAFEIATKSAVRQAGAGHDLMDRNIFKAMAIE